MYYSYMHNMFGGYSLFAAPFVIGLAAWSLVWKGWALWIAARKEHKIWFAVLLVLNTLGIVEILYIFVFSKMRNGCCAPLTRGAPPEKKQEKDA